jgi:hypothetical protein
MDMGAVENATGAVERPPIWKLETKFTNYGTARKSLLNRLKAAIKKREKEKSPISTLEEGGGI